MWGSTSWACCSPHASCSRSPGALNLLGACDVERDAKINQAEGEAEAILAVATATAEGLRRVGEALSGRGGIEAMQLRVAEEYVKQFGHLADEASSTLIVPANLSDIASMIALATSVVKNQTKTG